MRRMDSFLSIHVHVSLIAQMMVDAIATPTSQPFAGGT